MLDSKRHILLTNESGVSLVSEEAQTTDYLDTESISAVSRRNKTVIVPRVQSMQNYILKHHKRKILNEINRQIYGGTLCDIRKDAEEPITIRADQCSFGEMCFWRHDTYTLLVDVRVSVHIQNQMSVLTHDLYCELWVDMRKGISIACGECGFHVEKPERNKWMLSSYLVPILRKDEVEQGAEELLLKYCPTALTDTREYDAYVRLRSISERPIKWVELFLDY